MSAPIPRKPKMPSMEAVAGFIGLVGTIVGIITFFLFDLPSLFRPDEPEGLTEAQVFSTIVALQNQAQSAELQLTQIAVNQQTANNQATADAFSAQQAALQSTLDYIGTQQANAVATNNAIIEQTATAEFLATQQSLDATATAQAIAQITPTATSEPTATPAPAVAVDYRSIFDAAVALTADGRLVFTLTAAQPIPSTEDLAYTWMIDEDGNAATGLSTSDIGADLRVGVRFESGQWFGRVARYNEDGSISNPLLFVDVRADGASILAELDPVEMGVPLRFDWVVRAEQGEQVFSGFPAAGHNSFGG